MPRTRRRPGEPVTVPFTILIDQQEKAPFNFHGLLADADQQHRPLIVPTQRVHLKPGDYSIAGLQTDVTVERKSLADLFGTLGQGLERFRREHERMAEMKRAVVVVESSWFEAIYFPPPHSKLPPKTVFRVAASWQARYGIPWVFMGDRRLAEIFTFRFLSKYWETICDGNTKHATDDADGC